MMIRTRSNSLNDGMEKYIFGVTADRVAAWCFQAKGTPKEPRSNILKNQKYNTPFFSQKTTKNDFLTIFLFLNFIST